MAHRAEASNGALAPRTEQPPLGTTASAGSKERTPAKLSLPQPPLQDGELPRTVGQAAQTPALRGWSHGSPVTCPAVAAGSGGVEPRRRRRRRPWRAIDVRVGREDATVALTRPQNQPAPRALVEPLASSLGHLLAGCRSASRARDHSRIPILPSPRAFCHRSTTRSSPTPTEAGSSLAKTATPSTGTGS